MDKTLDAGLELDERPVIRDVGDPSREARPNGILRFDSLPRIILQLFHAERDAVGLVVDLDDLDPHLLSDVEHFARMVDAAPSDVGDMQQPVDAAEIHKGPVVRDVLDDSVDDLALFEILHELLALLGAGLFQHSAPRDHDISAAAIHLEDLERLRLIHQWRDVADGSNIDLASRQEGDGAIEIDGEAALDLIEDDALHFLIAIEGFLELAPAFLAPRLIPREHGLSERILHPFEINLDGVADLDVRLPSRTGEFAQRHTSLGFRANIDDRHVLLDAHHHSFHNRPFLRSAFTEGLVQHLGKILARGDNGACGSGNVGGGHEYS